MNPGRVPQRLRERLPFASALSVDSLRMRATRLGDARDRATGYLGVRTQSEIADRDYPYQALFPIEHRQSADLDVAHVPGDPDIKLNSSDS